MTLRHAAQQALEALEAITGVTEMDDVVRINCAITALHLALEVEQQDKPVAWTHDCAALCANDVELWIARCPHCGKPRRPQPAQQPLTEEPVGYGKFEAGELQCALSTIFIRRYGDGHMRYGGCDTPLYTHPQPAQQPLTDEVVSIAAHQSHCIRTDFIEGVRFAERAHHIGGEA